MRLRLSLLAAFALCALPSAAAAQSLTPGVLVPGVIGLNWEDTGPLSLHDGALEAHFRPLVTATETAELAITDPVGASIATRGRLRFGNRALGSPLQILLSGRPRGTLDAPGAASLFIYPGGGVTGRPEEITLRAPSPPSGTPDDLEVVISLTDGP